MVAPAEGSPRKQKWRNHCSTCGVKFATPQLWAYCSKSCEAERRGLDMAEGSGTDEWLVGLHEERMRLRDELSMVPPYLRAEIVAAIMANEAREDAVRAELAAITAPKDSALFWIQLLRGDSDRFELSMRRSLAAAVRLGKRLLQARDSVPHGEFGRLFAEHENRVPQALTFSSSWARKLMTIASHPVIEAEAAAPNRDHEHVLPADVNTVYLLARLPVAELEDAITNGQVTPTMRRADARDLLPAPDGEPAEPDDLVEATLLRVLRILRAFAADRTSLFGELKSRLKAALRAIESEIGGGQ